MPCTLYFTSILAFPKAGAHRKCGQEMVRILGLYFILTGEEEKKGS
jgi:hypothetical protein